MLYGWIGGNSNYNNGYTAVSFIGLYILGRYLSIYCRLIPINWVILFIVSTGLNFFLIFLDTTFFKCVGLSRLMSYVNPIIILQSASLLMIFSKISLNVNRTINFVAKSSFAVYLLHDCSKYEESLMVRAVNIISENFNDVAYFGVILACIVAIYFIAVSIDQLRIFSWNKIKSSLSRVLDKDIFQVIKGLAKKRPDTSLDIWFSFINGYDYADFWHLFCWIDLVSVKTAPRSIMRGIGLYCHGLKLQVAHG